MKAPQFRELRIKDLKSAHYNPPDRITKDRIRDLVNSIGDIGLMYPILVTEDNIIIDGHRRVAAYKELGLDTIPAIVGIGDPNRLYANLNATSRKMGGNESLVVYMKQPEAVTPMQKTRFDNMILVLGMPRVKIMVKEGFSIRLYNRARQVCMYCDQDMTRVPAIFDWLVQVTNSKMIEVAMSQGMSPISIMKAVRGNKKLKLKTVLA